MKIANKISLSFFATAIILTAIGGFVFLRVAENSLKQEIVAHFETTAHSREVHAEAFAPVKRLRVGFIIVLIVIPAAAYIMGRVIAKRITEPIHRLHEGTEVIAAGNLAYRVGTPARDEIGQLSRAFDTMTAELKKKIVSINDLNKEITERKKAEEPLRVNDSRNRTLIENIPQKIFLKDKNLVYVTCNEKYARDLKIGVEEIVGKTDYDFYPRDLAEKYRADDKRVMGSWKAEHLEESYFQDGQARLVSTVKTPVMDDQGNVVGVLGIFSDITEQKKLRDQLTQSQTMAALGRFSAGASHEIKNPLGIILGGMEYLRAKYRDADEESKETMGMVSNAVLRVDSIINALNELAGPSEHRVRKVDAKTMVDDVILNFGSKFKDRQIGFSTTAEDGFFIEVDIDHMQHALLSILTNAADAMPTGSEVKITIRKELPATCVIEIADTGEGISEETMPKIFEPFFTTRRDRKQIGFGLTVAKEFINLNKGDISITSKKGEGTAVKISFPIAA